MANEWATLCRSSDLLVDGSHVSVQLGARAHRVSVEENDDSYTLRAIVVRRAVVESDTELPIKAWRRNRGVALVGFRIDKGRRLVAEAWVPKTGLTRDEFQLYLRTVARESDRFEYELTGRDVE